MHDLPTTDLHKLLDDLRSAKEGSRELSDRVLVAINFFHQEEFGLWGRKIENGGGLYEDTISPTESLDDAIGLVLPPDWRIYKLEQQPDGQIWCCGIDRLPGQTFETISPRDANSAALAVCRALIAMKIAESET